MTKSVINNRKKKVEESYLYAKNKSKKQMSLNSSMNFDNEESEVGLVLKMFGNLLIEV